MKLVFTEHLRIRLKQRDISAKIIKEIFDKKEENYWDNLRNRHIVVSEVVYKGKHRKMLAAYDKIGDSAEVVTTHPIEEDEIRRRIISGRWSYEKEQN